MEASSAAVQTGGEAEGQAAGQTAAPGTEQGTTGQEAAETGGAQDLGPVLERMEELSGRVGQLHELLGVEEEGAGGPEGQFGAQAGNGQFPGQELGQQQGQAAGQLSDPVIEQLEAVYGPDGAQQIVGGLMQRMETQMQAQMAPVQQQLMEMRVEAGAQELESKYPDLGPGETAEAVWQEAQELAAEFGNPDLVLNHRFIERVYLSKVARDRASSETPAGTAPGQVDLEGGEGANPAGTATDGVTPQQSIVAAGGRRGSNVFGL